MGNCCSSKHEEFNLVGYEDQSPEPGDKASILTSFSHSKLLLQKKPFYNSTCQSSSDQRKPKKPEKPLKKEFQSQNPNRDNSLLLLALNTQFSFNTFPEEQQETILNKIQYLEFPASQSLCLKENSSQLLWVIQKGKIEISDGFMRKVLVKGNIFGNFSSNRLKFATTLEKSALWAIDRSILTLTQSTSDDLQEISNFLQTSHVFQHISKDQKLSLMNYLTVVKYLEGEIIIEEGKSGDLFFFIKSGSVMCKSPGKFIKYLSSGECFGELASLYNMKRTCTITAVSTVKCLVINIFDLKSVLGKDYGYIVYKNPIRLSLEKSALNKFLKTWHYEELIENMELFSYSPQSTVIPDNTCKNEGLFIVLQGKLSSHSEVFCELSVLGDLEIVENSSEKFSEVTATTPAEVAYISKANLLHIIQEVPQDSDLHRALNKNHLFNLLSAEKIMKIKKSLKIQEFQSGQTIFTQGSPGDDLFIVKFGFVGVYIEGKFIRTIEDLDYFGERSLILNEPRSATVKAESFVQCWVLNKSDFLQIVDQSVLNVLHKKMKAQDTDFSLNDLLVIKKLADGQLGDVLLAKCMKNSQFYALKVVEKSRVASQDIQKNLLHEKNLLLDLHHCFIPSLVKTFRDSSRVYFLLEYVQGEDLFDVIRKLGLLNEEDAKFYTCCLMLILDYLHKKKIVYRDLKPENVMIDEVGYPNLIDFGAARRVVGKTNTFIGTPYYIAPEVINGEGYSTQVDHWSLGIMLYEFVFGVVPFGETETDSYKIFEEIIHGPLLFPEDAEIKPLAKNFISLLLEKDPESRIQDPLTHEWLKDTDFDGLENKKFKPPYIPSVSDLVWVTNKARVQSKKIESFADSCEDSWDAEFAWLV